MIPFARVDQHHLGMWLSPSSPALVTTGSEGARGLSQTDLGGEKFKGKVTKNPGPLCDGWELENALQHHLGWERGKNSCFPQKAAPCLGSRLYPEMTLEDLARGQECILLRGFVSTL